MTDGIPPQALQVEQGVIGALLLFGLEALSEAEPRLKPNYFYREAHRFIYYAMLWMKRTGKDISVTSVSSSLRDKDLLESCGGNSYLLTVMSCAVNRERLLPHCQWLQELYVRRLLLCAGDAAKWFALEAEYEDVSELVTGAMEELKKVAAELPTKDAANFAHSAKRVAHLARERALGKSLPKRTKIGLRDLDRLTDGIGESDYVIVAARPSVGKSVFVANVALKLMAQGKRLAFFTLEMTEEQVTRRMLCALSGLSYRALEWGTLEPHEWKRLERAEEVLDDYACHIVDKPGLTTADLDAYCQSFAQGGLDALIVDYAQILRYPSPAESDVSVQGRISAELRRLSLELGVPLIAVAQASRAAEGRADKRPMLSDIFGSSRYEADADQVWLLHRDAYYQSEEERNSVVQTLEIIVGKCRNGMTGTAKAMMNPVAMQVENFAEDWREEPSSFYSKKEEADFTRNIDTYSVTGYTGGEDAL